MEDCREEIIRDLHWSICGPSPFEKHEDGQSFAFLDGKEGDPGSRFITGILSPQLALSDSESSLDDTPFSATGCSDSSFGFTCCVPFSAKTLSVEARVSHYERDSVGGGEREAKRRGFRRVPAKFEKSIALEAFPSESNEVEWTVHTFGPESDKVLLSLIKRRDIECESGNVYTLSIFHAGKGEGGFRPWDRTAFHVGIHAKCDKDFAPLPHSIGFLNADGERSDLLYRDVFRYAVGHGCGIQQLSGNEIKSTFFPEKDVPVFKHRISKSEALSMSGWASGELGYDELDTIPDEYAEWLSLQSQAESDLGPVRQKTLKQNCADAETCIARMRKGIARLKSDVQCQSAFQWMNEAMLIQQIRSKTETVGLKQVDGDWVYEDHNRVDPLDNSTWPGHLKGLGNWRLFQMAFILMCLDDVSGGQAEENLDLIWFPTGGGKTEAYLGLSAFLLLHNRLNNGDFKGVRIIMRYTLRLLTSQQFERATSLILALDEVRSRENELGSTPFSIGLWVGGSVTFNTQSQASRWYSELELNPKSSWNWVLQRCPRCSREFGLKRQGGATKAFGVERDANGLVHFSCSCDAGSKLPIHVVDEDIYDELPSLVVATVDKFARLSWKPRSSRLLGVHAHGRNKHSQVAMIIQDELHLMDGPLGTIAGLYEAGVDYLISKTGASPKRIGSSATLAMASEQCRDLYGVPMDAVRVFPVQVLNWHDNYFSQVDRSQPARKYVGVYANGSPSNKTTQYKMFASLMRTGSAMGDAGGGQAEGYSTLVNYFNSRKDQGQALSLMGDDVPRELGLLAQRYGDDKRQYIDVTDAGLVQLHGNVNADEVQRSFGRLRHSYGHKNHVKAVLATNMISVGLDVSRLGLMAMIHQPKSMSEYIQASSRVGRGKTPGLVFVMLSSLRSRDKSHLEDFAFTHEKMYSLVEPSSLTPFSSSAMERALPGVLIAMFRNDPDFEMQDSPKPIPKALKNEVHQFLVNRLMRIDPDEEAQFLQLFEEFCHAWNHRGFASYGQEVRVNAAQFPLMVPFITPLKSDVRPFQVLQAMRNVDVGLELRQIERQ